MPPTSDFGPKKTQVQPRQSRREMQSAGAGGRNRRCLPGGEASPTSVRPSVRALKPSNKLIPQLPLFGAGLALLVCTSRGVGCSRGGRVTGQIACPSRARSAKNLRVAEVRLVPSPYEQAPKPPAVQASKGWTQVAQNPVKRWEHLKSDTPHVASVSMASRFWQSLIQVSLVAAVGRLENKPVCPPQSQKLALAKRPTARKA